VIGNTADNAWPVYRAVNAHLDTATTSKSPTTG
jgi:hypothetical protein